MLLSKAYTRHNGNLMPGTAPIHGESGRFKSIRWEDVHLECHRMIAENAVRVSSKPSSIHILPIENIWEFGLPFWIRLIRGGVTTGSGFPKVRLKGNDKIPTNPVRCSGAHILTHRE